MDTINKWAILDSGATSNFLTTSIPITTVQNANKSIVAHRPNGNQVQTTHTCMFDLPELPAAAHLAHIIPGLALHSLISVVTLCNTGCKVLFTKIGCTIMHQDGTILCGSKCMHTGLWMIPLQPSSPPITLPTTALPLTAMVANVAPTSMAGDHARFIYQALCSPPTPTLLWALMQSSKFTTIPGLTPQLIIYHLLPSTATNKGHM
jgi:hypothetical protein